MIHIKLKRANKVYHEGDNVSGIITIDSKTDLRHDGILLIIEGSVNLQLSSKNVGIFDAFYNSVKPMTLVLSSIEVSKPGKIPSGKTEIPFEFLLAPKGSKTLFETYHGVFVNIKYILKCDMKRSLMSKDIQKVTEFLVEYKEENTEVASPKPLDFSITPESLQNIRDVVKVPRFKITGKLDSVTCCISQPFTGHLVIESCEVPLKSIELQLLRVETCGCAEGYAREATEVQNIQIGDGDVCRGIEIPIYMIFPRLFTCPTLVTNNFKVEFELNIVFIFADDHLITENFPIRLTRY